MYAHWMFFCTSAQTEIKPDLVADLPNLPREQKIWGQVMQALGIEGRPRTGSFLWRQIGGLDLLMTIQLSYF